jgi:hypothetical protein
MFEDLNVWMFECLCPSIAGLSRLFQFFQGFEQHKEESDPDRIKQIISRSVEDAAWIVKKVNLNTVLPIKAIYPPIYAYNSGTVIVNISIMRNVSKPYLSRNFDDGNACLLHTVFLFSSKSVLVFFLD